MYMGCADQHRHRNDCERLSGLGAMWTEWRDVKGMEEGVNLRRLYKLYVA